MLRKKISTKKKYTIIEMKANDSFNFQEQAKTLNYNTILVKLFKYTSLLFEIKYTTSKVQPYNP